MKLQNRVQFIKVRENYSRRLENHVVIEKALGCIYSSI